MPKPMRKKALKKPERSSEKAQSTLKNWLKLAQLHYEKCGLKEARVAYEMALRHARKVEDLRGMMEAISGLLRVANEALDEESIRHWDKELDSLMSICPTEIPPMAWYCKGVVARQDGHVFLAQKHVHRYLRAVKNEDDESIARGWVMLATILWQRKRIQRSRWLAEEILRRYEVKYLRGINGMVYLLLGNLSEAEKRPDLAWKWFQKAHTSFLSEHNWYYHLYVIYGYARLNRMQQNYSQAYWHLDLLDKAAAGPEFGLLQREVALERSRLQQDAVDLLIDGGRGTIRTREGDQISLRKQYVLLHILETLSLAHNDKERGVSKAEIIERVWKENYRPEAHDNKLYYNINRLRRLIEPDSKKPQYLLNWKEGYRLAPGLRVHFVGPGKKAEGGGTQ